jgi:phosphohistidine phosphatase
MRRLILLRHSKAERPQPGTPDIDRKLIERGHKDAGSVGAYMATHALVPDRVLVSPATRTQQTWKAVASAFRPAPGAKSVQRLYEASEHTLLASIKDIPASAHSLLVVGHNPGLHALALLLIASGDIETREKLAEKLPTSGLVLIDFAIDDWSKLHPRSGRLERYVTPKSLDTGGY